MAINMTLLCLLAISVVLSGCQSDQKVESELSLLNLQTSKVSVPSVQLPSVKSPKVLSPHATTLATVMHKQKESTTKAARKNDCPKIVDFITGNNTVQDTGTMHRNTCKYFMYPKVGDSLKARIDNSHMRVQLAQPHFFEFSEDVYTVKNPGKHVLEVKYKTRANRVVDNEYTLEITKLRK